METGPAQERPAAASRATRSIMLQMKKELNELLVRKEQEWEKLQACQLCFQKTTLQDTRKQLQEMHKKFNRLKEDFTYNLGVLEERDRELERYDAMFTHLKMAENAKQAEVSDLRIQLDKLQQTLVKETRKQEALQYQYQQKLKEHQLEMERLHSSKVSDIDHHSEEYKKLKQELERKLQEVEGELALQKQELLVEFDAEIKKREHAFQRQADEMSNLVLSHELKVKLLTRELEALKEAGMKAAESLQIAETTNLKLEKEAKCKDWELKDLAAVKDAQIQDLEWKLHLVYLTWQKEEETFQRKHEVLDRFAKEKDAVLVSVKEVHAEQIQKWENQIRELQIRHETLEMELHRREWRHADCLRGKDAVIEKLQEELTTLKTSWDSHLAQISKETVSKDLQIQSLHEEEVKLRAELARFQQDIERYKQQLSLAAEREQILERAKVQAELDWQRRCENAERNQYQKSEDLIQSLSTARDQVIAQLQEKEQKLCEMETVLSALTFERDQAVQALQKHGILPEGEKQTFLGDNKGVLGKDFPAREIQRLKEQNTSLRAAIAEMRKEMETLSDQTPSSFPRKEKIQYTQQTAPDAKASTVIFTPDYVQSLEEEIRKLKHKCWIMEEQLEKASKFPRKSSVPSHDPSSTQHHSAPPITQLHTHNFNETNGAFCADEVFSGAPLKNLEARTAHLDSMVTQHIQKDSVIKGLQEEIVDLRQQLSGVGSSDGPQQYMNYSTQEMQNKLKEAVRKITILSQEKQQLIEMGNKLRAELGVVSKKGLQHYISSKQCPVHTVYGALYPKELANEAQHRLSALEHLQYQLTTRELQYAQRQRFSRLTSMVAFPSSIESLSDENVPSTCGETAELPQIQVQLESSVRNCSPGQQKESTSSETNQSQQLSRESQSQQARMSSSGVYSSLQEIWQILDMGSSPSILSPQSNIDQEFKATHTAKKFEESQQNIETGDQKRAPAADLTVKGTNFEVQPKLIANKSSQTHPRKSKISHQMQKIRNYNVKH
ncbi:coiled-coil domain-containing protein 57 isoform X1 [Chelonia mydas]|uniref:coiled-coil domain-containing protein 57 isoform X1 n=2 Tax=Chelonia mydas TaxID=8469 RepID=UPI0018A1B782|nr:coiled-coil domain-containing protein 57 isoform X1 [Chelonia mydas]XP_043384920.1 coiled-coil domain-containing protein 57 isoform X1 [Chelonia mydas]